MKAVATNGLLRDRTPDHCGRGVLSVSVLVLDSR